MNEKYNEKYEHQIREFAGESNKNNATSFLFAIIFDFLKIKIAKQIDY